MQSRRPQLDSWVRKSCWRRNRLPTPVFLGFPGCSADKESACNVGDLSLSVGLGRSPGEGIGYPLQYYGLENSGLYSPWGCKELDTAEWLLLSLSLPKTHLTSHSRMSGSGWLTYNFNITLYLLSSSKDDDLGPSDSLWSINLCGWTFSPLPNQSLKYLDFFHCGFWKPS